MSTLQAVISPLRAGVGRLDGAVTAFVLVVAGLALAMPDQALESLRFTGIQLIDIAPYLTLAVVLAAYAGATDADHLIARSFSGNVYLMIPLAALAGALSPFCSCGVIPLIAALLSMGVPLAPVMAFWLSSPLMDPSMFLLTAGQIGFDFAIAKTLAAFGLGLLGGFGVQALAGTTLVTGALRDGIGNGGCGGAKVRKPKEVSWAFWSEAPRRAKFARETGKTIFFLGKWLALAYLLESLMLAWIPAESVSELLGGGGWFSIALASLAGVPAYLNGYAAVPLVSGLLEQGMAPGASMAFLVAGGVTSIPAAVAVFALVRPPVFVLYLVFALLGALGAGGAFQVAAAL